MPKNKSVILILVLFGMLLSAVFFLSRTSFDNDVSVMLPRNLEILRVFRFFRQAPFTSNAVVSFEMKGENVRFQDLIRAADEFTAKVQSPMITRVTSGADSSMTVSGMLDFVKAAPQLAGPSQLAELETKMSAEAVRAKMDSIYKMSLNPAGSFMLPLTRLDPLGFHEDALKKLRSLLEGLDYDVHLEQGHLISRDGRHALVILETKVPVTDGPGARKLTDFIQGTLTQLPPGISAELISGHLHTVSNEKMIRRDIAVTSGVTAVLFIALFFLIFKDSRALLLFAIPAVSVLLAVPFCALVFGKLSAIILGMGAVISGIAVDYCIHVYVAMQSVRGRKEVFREIAVPILGGAMTTVGVFAVFLFSNVPGNRQLALLTILSLLFSLGIALFIFPVFLSKPAQEFSRRAAKTVFSLPAFLDLPAVAVWGSLLLACAAAVPLVHFRMDVRQYDGSEKSIFETEEKFQAEWGGKAKPAMMVFEAPSFDQALEKSSAFSYAGFASVWPSENVRKENLENWNAYWSESRVEKLREVLRLSGEGFGFSQTAFGSFFENLRPGAGTVSEFKNLTVLEPLRKRFTYEADGKNYAVTFFPDEEKTVSGAVRQASGIPGAFVVSVKRFERLLSKSTLGEAVYLGLAILVMLPLMAFCFLKSIRLTLVSLIPVVTSVLFAMGSLAVFRLNLNVSSLVALMVVGGISIDYGLFMIYENLHQLKTNTLLAVTLSALTTILGAGALVFAKHPVLHTYGITLVCGVTAGYLSAIFTVPAVYRLAKCGKTAVLNLRTA